MNINFHWSDEAKAAEMDELMDDFEKFEEITTKAADQILGIARKAVDEVFPDFGEAEKNLWIVTVLHEAIAMAANGMNMTPGELINFMKAIEDEVQEQLKEENEL